MRVEDLKAKGIIVIGKSYGKKAEGEAESPATTKCGILGGIGIINAEKRR
ncbi:hypothetical protein [Bacillus sp. FJAT-52991]|uniref:Uncharacterized protein n=1 Tax=Bacillus kandeliae TaxID=3129297 RepID=A0ABZ2N6V3_9BACI